MTRRPVFVLLVSCVAVAFSATIALSMSVIKGNTWFPIGPAPISPGYGGVAAGRAAVLAVNPDNADHVFLGSATGGVWLTLNAGLSWTPIGDNAPALAIGAIALDPDHCTAQGCDRIYVGTGEDTLRRDTYYGRGLLIGTPASGVSGVWSWQTKGESLFSLASVIDVVLDPTTVAPNKRIYVAVSSGVTASASESTITGPEPGMGFGIYKSENDGTNWTKVDVPNTGGAKPTDLEMDPQNSNLLFAGFLGKGIFKGVRDPMSGSITWCPLNEGTGGTVCMGATGLPNAQSSTFDFVEITVHHPGGGSAVLYALFGNCPDPICESCNPRIFKSTDGGTVWTEQNNAAPNAYSRYTHVLTTHPADHTKLLYGGLGLHLSFNSAADFNSDGVMGDDDILSKGGGNQAHPDQQDIVFADPSGACTMVQCMPGGGGAGTCVIYVVSDGGFYRSTNGGCTFQARDDGLQITGLQSIAASPDTPVVLGGTQDNGTVYFSGSSTWAHKSGGDTTGTIIDAATPTRTFDITVPSCSVERWIERSTSGGSDFAWPTVFTTPNNQDTSFYPPMVQDPSSPYPLYLGTTKLYRGTNQGTVFSDVSPALGGNQFFSDIQRTNVITAIGVAPSDPDRIYIGFYDGQIWVSGAGGPCTQMSCWTLVSMGKGLPATVVTWIAVDPGDEDVAYAAFSGFFSGPHLYKTINGGMTWTAANGAGPTMLPNVPANTVAIEPSDPNRIWVGTDSAPAPHLASVYKSTDGGASWVKFANGLPNAPIFELEILEKPGQGNTVLGQVYAATHGRGVFILTQPNITNFEGWVNGMIWDVPVYGDGFPKNQNCTVQILQSDGTVCAQGMTDARGGMIETNAQGKLTSSAPNYMGQDVVWACYVGTCVNGTPIGDCNDDENGDAVPDLLSTVLVECGGVLGIDKVLGCPDLLNPPASVLSLDEVLGGAVAGASAEGPAGGAMQTFNVMPAVQDADGSSRVLCEVPVVHAAGDSARMILEAARDAINNDPACQAESVMARVPPAPVDTDEDVLQKPVLGIEATNVTGGQITLGVRVDPGQDTGTCFNLEGLGATALKQILIPRLKFTTAAGGATGGRIRLVEHSPLGACDLTVPTSPGDTPGAIIAAFNAMYQAPGIPGPHPACPSSHNARDAMLHGGDSLIFSLATGLVICADDPGVGFLVAPKEICFTDSDCDDMNPCTNDACLAASQKCDNRPVPSGTPCQDGNACTIMNFCHDGVCGVPVICDDQNPCTIDHCDPATGECRFTPLICNDGNACTADFCDQRIGGCRFSTLTGQACDDGEACTSGDTCIQGPVGGPPSCQGSPVPCGDNDPCTLEVCDPNTGQCLVSPLQCDDGNLCTRDFCDPGAGGCVFAPTPGATCSDGDRCTLDDRCIQDATGAIRCVGTPLVCDDQDRCTVDFCDPQAGLCRFAGVDCDDQNSCTADACSPDTGLCEHRSIALLEVTPVKASGSILLEWTVTPDATHWNTYRGTIPSKMLGSRLPGSVYDHVCFESDDAAGDGATTAIDPAVPPPGTAYYYDFTGEGICGEGPLGAASSGLTRPMLIPCPTPP